MQSLASTLAPVAAVPCRAQRPACGASSSRPFATLQLQQHRRLQLARAETSSSEQEAAQQAAPAAATQQQQPAVQQEEEPIWVRRERERQLQAQEGSKDLPFGLYLLFSSFTAIATVGSVFEYVNRNPVFDVIPPESPLWAPILGFFAFTGLPTTGFLFYKAVSAANKEAERMDKLDGY